MNRRLFFRLLVLATFTLLAPVMLRAQSLSGAIKAVRVSGSVVKTVAGGPGSTPLAEGAPLIETDTVTTGDGSSVVLVFANGASVKLGANSRLAIEEFKMDPLLDDIAVAELQHEPNISQTRLTLAYGEMVGNVKKLNTSAGSKFDIKTPVGAAGIRGTTFRIVMRFEASGQVTFTLSTSEGSVVFSGTIPIAGSSTTSPEGTGEEVSVAGGQEVTAVATVNPATNQVTNVQVSSTQPISPAASEAINTAVTQAIQQAQQSATFTQAEQQQAAQQTNSPTPQSNPNDAGSSPPPTTQQTPLDTAARSGSG